MPIHRLRKSKHGLLIMILSSVLLAILVASSLYYFVRDIRVTQDKVIIQHLAQLSQIMNEIEASCGIIDFDHEKNYIDFLNVKSFVGSEVGAMNLKHPEKWNGPYIEANPTVQEQPYMIVKNRKGFYIVPGDGVRLANGKIIGKDIKLNYNTDIDALLRDPNGLLFKNQPLAVKLSTQTEKDKKIEAVAESISEHDLD